MKKMINNVTIEGRLYDTSKLVAKVTGPDSKNPGTPSIRGSIDIATDEEGLNIITWYLKYGVTPKTNNGGENKTYTVLNNILNGGKTWVADGKDAAMCVRINANLELNDFYPSGTGNQETLVSQMRAGGGFIDVIAANELNPDENKRALFEMDAVLNSVREVEENEEREIPAHTAIHGAAFSFRGDLLPFNVVCENPNGMTYFSNLDVSNANQVFTKIWGMIVSKNIQRKIVTESAFGETFVKNVPFTQKKWVVTGVLPEPYLFDDESTITKQELSEAAANREIYLANEKIRQAEWRESQGKAAAATMPVPQADNAPNTEIFNF